VTVEVDGTDPHDTVALAFPIVKPEIVGAIGTPSGVTVVVAAVALVNDELEATTETEYRCPLIRPVIEHENPVVTQPALAGTVVTE
jgi:hypothetical protein